MQTTDFVATIFDGKSNPNKVTVSFAMALNALMKGHSATLILMVAAQAQRLSDSAALFQAVGAGWAGAASPQ